MGRVRRLGRVTVAFPPTGPTVDPPGRRASRSSQGPGHVSVDPGHMGGEVRSGVVSTPGT